MMHAYRAMLRQALNSTLFDNHKYRAHPQDIRLNAARGLDRAQVAELLTCQWVRSGHNMLLSGPTGVGKTWLACAFGMAAIHRSLSVRYLRAGPALEDMRLAHLDGSINKLR